tara:strand:- start:687 stop:1196 length:510 start_codon:yes stop_codon:yes gene_type:complete
MSKFNKCLLQGQFYELEFLKYIDFDDFTLAPKGCKEYDLKILKDDKLTFYEVKSEMNCRKYGNACIEYECNGKISGINATTSDFWVHFNIIDKDANEYIIYLIPVEKLREMIKNLEYKKDMRGGDGMRAKFYLFDLKKFEPYIFPLIKIKNDNDITFPTTPSKLKVLYT